MMRFVRSGLLSGLGVAAGMSVVLATAMPAMADSLKDEPIYESGRSFEYSFNLGATSDYVFRGISQTDSDPTVQGGADVSYGGLYAGVWASGVDFGDDSADAEVDFYAGYKHSLGPVSFDLGVIYYIYPGAEDAGNEYDYVELKFGVGTSIDKLSLGATAFYSPEYTGEVGEAWIFEGTAGYELPTLFSITPTISGTVGTVQFDEAGNTDYVYWNAGMSFLAAEKLTIDLRYWDSDLSDSECGVSGTCDERFVATVKLTLP